MPRIRTYEQQVGLQGDIGGRRATGADFGAGVYDEAIKGVQQFAAKLEEKKVQDDEFRANLDYLKAKEDLSTFHLQLKQKAPEDGVGYAEISSKKTEEYVNAFMSERKYDPRVMQQLQLRMSELSTSFDLDALQFEAAQRTAFKRTQLEEASKNAERLAYDSGDVVTTAKDYGHLVAASGADGSVKASLLRSTRNGTAKAAALGMIDREQFDALEARLKPGGDLHDLLTAEQLSSLNQKLLAEKEAKKRLSQAALAGDYADYISFLQAGNLRDAALESKLISGLADKKPDIAESFETNAKLGADLAELKFASPERKAEILNPYADALKSPNDYKEKAAYAQALQKSIISQQTDFVKDPSGYVSSKSDVADALQKADMARKAYAEAVQKGEPGAIAAAERAAASANSLAIRLSVDAQTDMGLLPQWQRILPDSRAEAIVTEINTAAQATLPGEKNRGENLMDKLTSYEAQYGSYWPAVAQELVNKGANPLLIAATNVRNPISRELLASAPSYMKEIKAEGVGGLVKKAVGGDNAAANSMMSSITKDMSPFLSTLPPGDTHRVQDAAQTLAAMYVLKQGWSEEEATNQAVKDLSGDYVVKSSGIIDSFRFGGPGNFNLRIPADQAAVDRDYEGTMRAVIDSISSGEVPVAAIGTPSGGVLSAEDYARHLRSFGRWRTSSDDKGIILFDKSGEAVRRPDGSMLFVPFSEVPTTKEMDLRKDPTYPLPISLRSR